MTTQVQFRIDGLTKKAIQIESQISIVRNDISLHRNEASQNILDGRSTVENEESLFRSESRLKTLEGALQVAKNKLSEENRNLIAAKKIDATKSLNLIKNELDNTAAAMEKHLSNAIKEAESFEYLLNEAALLHEREKVSLSLLGSYVHAISRLNCLIPIDTPLKEILARLKQYKNSN